MEFGPELGGDTNLKTALTTTVGPVTVQTFIHIRGRWTQGWQVATFHTHPIHSWSGRDLGPATDVADLAEAAAWKEA